DDDAELDGVVVDDLRRIVRPCVDEPGPRAWIGTQVETTEPGDRRVRELLRKELRAGEEEGKVEAIGRALALGPAGRVSVNCALPVGVPRKGELVDEGRREGADQAQRPRAVGPRPEGKEAVQVPLERRAEIPGDVGAAEAEVMFLVQQVI